MLATGVLAVIIGYLLGSIPFAYIVGWLVKRVDIRQVGGGNVGALNTMREVGTVAGLAVLFAARLPPIDVIPCLKVVSCT